MLDSDFSVSRNIIYVFSLKVIGALSKLIFSYLLARYFGSSGAGEFFLALTIVMILSTVSRLGFENVVLRFSAIYHSENNWHSLNLLYKRSLSIVAILSLILSMILYGLSDVISHLVFSKEELSPLLKGMALSVSFLSILGIQAAAFKGVGRVIESQLYEVVGINLLTTAILFLMETSIGIYGVAMAYLAASSILVIMAFLRWSVYRGVATEKHDVLTYKTIFLISLPLLFSNSLSLIISWADILMLGALSSSSEVGIYGVASRMVLIISFGLAALNSVLAAKFSVLFAQGNISEVERIAKKYSRVITLLTCPLLLVFVFFSEQVMSVFGDEFVTGMYALTILALGQFINVATGSVSMAMVMKGEQNILLIFLAVSVIVNISLNFLLIPSLGATGAATATSVSFIMLNLLGYFYCRFRFNIRLGVI